MPPVLSLLPTALPAARAGFTAARATTPVILHNATKETLLAKLIEAFSNGSNKAHFNGVSFANHAEVFPTAALSYPGNNIQSIAIEKAGLNLGDKTSLLKSASSPILFPGVTSLSLAGNPLDRRSAEFDTKIFLDVLAYTLPRSSLTELNLEELGLDLMNPKHVETLMEAIEKSKVHKLNIGGNQILDDVHDLLKKTAEQNKDPKVKTQFNQLSTYNAVEQAFAPSFVQACS